ncbi:EAL domain-containing protein [Lactobacillus sp. LC28-10]|uniref:EAL domain-containing protein n=1 Tax=Secundilactobacillus angelensis TaxID=2722706 RepID=A0ABX1L1J1_9LACO|nr:EAL domain-containing protein [Secundilactobacillus angelensis]NLR18938.1 EAL domain-containing protein [Secundilactobacillus angelensis]
MYRYFIQPQLNKFTNSLIGYEMLIRKYDDEHWRLPQNFAAIPVDEQIDLLKKTAHRIGLKVGSISFNLNRRRFIDPHMEEALIGVQSEIFPVKLIIEVTEEESDLQEQVPDEKIALSAKRYAGKGVQISLDDVGSGCNTYEHIKPLLAYANEIKFAMQNFRNENKESKIVSQLKFWKMIADKYQIRLVVEGTETEEEDQLLDDLDLPYRQGYFYGRPHLVKLE